MTETNLTMVDPEGPGPLRETILGAWERLFTLPVQGPVSREIWNGLGMPAIESMVLKGLVEKAELTRSDGRQHSFMMVLPPHNGLSVVLVGNTWPTSAADAAKEARDQFFGAGETVAARMSPAGVLQVDVFLGTPERLEIRIGWLPPGDALDGLPGPLRRSLLPWASEPRQLVETGPSPPDGATIVALAKITWRLTVAMRKRLRSWPAEAAQRSLDYAELSERCSRLAKRFNRVSSRAGLQHAMPVDDADDTWLPHNLSNTLRFRSLPASLKADLLRLWGPDARDRFAEAWSLFRNARPDRPSEDALTRLREAPLTLQRASAPSRVPEPVDAFISYAWSDKTRGARDIYQAVTTAGFSAWLDEEQLLDDATLNESIDAAMLRSRSILICISLEMLTRGGYALRELLLAISSVPERCLILRLDRTPAPGICVGLKAVDWWAKDGPDRLVRTMREQSTPGSTPEHPEPFTLANPLVERLIASVHGEGECGQRLDSSSRGTQLGLRARLYRTTHAVLQLQRRPETILDVVAGSDELLAWSTLEGQAAREDPTVFGAALRLRSALLRAHIHAGAHGDTAGHHRAAFGYLTNIVSIEPARLRPAPLCGWPIGDCRLAVQDCLDAVAHAKAWFRGWSPRDLGLMGHVPRGEADTIESRLAERTTLLADRMLALRAWEERISPAAPPSWSAIWSSLRNDLGRKVQAGGHPVVRAYFEELGRWVTGPVVDELVTAMADGVIASAAGERYREVLMFDLNTFRLRCVIRSARALESKRASLASVRGTVFDDLRGEGSGQGELNILFWTFSQPGTGSELWKYGLYLNCAATAHAEGAARLPDILRNPFLMGEMLTQDELARFPGDHEIHEEM